MPEIVVEIIVFFFGSQNCREIGVKSEHSCFERVQIPFKFHFSFHFSFQVSFHFSFHFSFHLNKTARQVCLKTQFALPWRAELGMVTCEVFPSKVHWWVPRKSIFDIKFDPQNGPRSPRGHPKPGSDTERRSQSASSAPGDAPGAQLEEIRGPVCLFVCDASGA